MTRHTVGRIGSGEYSCSCGAVWDYTDGPECPAQSSESPAQLGNRVHAEAQEAIECQARGVADERAAFECICPNFRDAGKPGLCPIHDANYIKPQQARAARSAGSQGGDV